MVERTFPPGTVATYDPGDAGSLAGAILAIIDGPAAREAATERVAAIVEASSWELEAARYVDLVDRLAGDRRPAES
jgi:hypothetical protein